MRRFFIALIGGTIVLIGLAMLVLPGPGSLVIAGGLAVLATEFIWARRAMRKAKGTVAKVRRKSGLKEWFRRWRTRASTPPPSAEKP
jgi:asparagine N-glycosylation enzyme membrane subunit Stt3